MATLGLHLVALRLLLQYLTLSFVKLYPEEIKLKVSTCWKNIPGGSIKSKCTRSSIPNFFNCSTTVPRFERRISGYVLLCISDLYAFSVYNLKVLYVLLCFLLFSSNILNRFSKFPGLTLDCCANKRFYSHLMGMNLATLLPIKWVSHLEPADS